MTTHVESLTEDVRRRMVDIGGRAAQDLGLSRVVGQMLIHLYLQTDEQSLDDTARDLGLSKAAVSIGLRQLEDLGLVKRVWRKGDRRHYYRTADNIGSALRQGLMTFLAQKIAAVSREVDAVYDLLHTAPDSVRRDSGIAFLERRVERARDVQRHAAGLLGNPLVRLVAKL
jgi:DNA-binding transcriptional regulator GbsR (MarR family)